MEAHCMVGMAAAAAAPCSPSIRMARTSISYTVFRQARLIPRVWRQTPTDATPPHCCYRVTRCMGRRTMLEHTAAAPCFSLNTDRTGFVTLYSFSATGTNSPGVYTNADGAGPRGLILSGNTLYATHGGGVSGNGTVFAINIDGTGFTNLHTFTTASGPYPSITNSDGAHPSAGLILRNNT